jgi:hypothetical protein
MAGSILTGRGEMIEPERAFRDSKGGKTPQKPVSPNPRQNFAKISTIFASSLLQLEA